MIERQVFHVVRRADESWQVIKEGFHRPHIVRDSKAEAVLIAKRLAKLNANARVVVHTPDNLVEREFNFLHAE